MRTLIVLTLLFTAANSSFLRQLPEVTISAITYTDSCFTVGSGSLEATMTVGTDLTTVSSPTFTATFTSGVTANDITGTQGTITASTIPYTIALTTAKTGVYKLKDIVDGASGASAHTFTLPSTNPTFVIVSDAALGATQTASQSVTEGDSSTGSFKIVFGAAVTNLPVIYTADDGKTVIKDCKVDSTTTTNVLCTPTSDEMEDGKNYTIHYHKDCTNGITTTGITVSFTAAEEPEDSSSFMTLGKVALIALAILF